MEIGRKTKQRIVDMVDSKLTYYLAEINEAFMRSDDDKLAISLPVTISPGKLDNSFKVKVGINFVAERIKSDSETTVSEAQLDLFEEEPEKRHRWWNCRPKPRVGKYPKRSSGIKGKPWPKGDPRGRLRYAA